MANPRASDARKRTSRSGRVFFLVAAGVVALVAAADASVQKLYEGKVLPRVRVGDVAVGGTKLADAEITINRAIDTIESEGFVIRYNGSAIPLDVTIADSSGFGLPKELLRYDAEATMTAALSFGHHNSFFRDTLDRLKILFVPMRITPTYRVDTAGFADAITAALGRYEHPVVEPGYVLKGSAITVTAGESGNVFDSETIVQEIEKRIRRLSRSEIPVSLAAKNPSVTDNEAHSIIEEVQNLVDPGSIALHTSTFTGSLKASRFISWLVPVRNDNAISVDVSEKKVREYLTGFLPEVNVPPKNARFQLDNGIVKELQSSSLGSELDIDAAVAAVSKAVLGGGHSVALAMKEVSPQATAGSIVNLGIVEKVAAATTNFVGSPVNRRYNIKIGSDLLNGLLIKPGEEFSLITAVGPVDATNGYRQELVIKGDRTIPEFGGGLCQIGTTFFRLVMNAGLPVLERQNHSYRVRYYEPPVGMDATIYEPKPDFRFKNDYTGYLLVQTRVEGDNLTFEFWGKKDGRTVTTTTPRVYNIVPAPAQLTIETTDIPPKTTKCIEKAHVGSDAVFTYGVTRADGTKKSQEFKSHYKPWRAVCYLGVKSLSPSGSSGSTNANSNTNTPTNTNTPVNTNTNVNANANQNSNANVNASVNTNTPLDNTNTATNTNAVP